MRRILWLVLLGAYALAAPPPFPENAAGIGYRHPGAGVVTVGAALPFSPMGLESGASLYLAADPGLRAVEGYLSFNLLVFPGLAVGPAFGEVGGFLRLDGVGFRLAWGAGLRAYPADALAVELGADDRLGLYATLLYLW